MLKNAIRKGPSSGLRYGLVIIVEWVRSLPVDRALTRKMGLASRAVPRTGSGGSLRGSCSCLDRVLPPPMNKTFVMSIVHSCSCSASIDQWRMTLIYLNTTRRIRDQRGRLERRCCVSFSPALFPPFGMEASTAVTSG